VRDGRPRPRRDIVRELRLNGNGLSGATEWHLQTLERQAKLRLRQQVPLPAIFLHTD
jgi:hypothetical protein